MDAVTHLAPTVGVVAACDVLGVARASFYRQRPRLGTARPVGARAGFAVGRAAPARALSPDERARVLTVLHQERFQDRSPAAVQATLLDEGQYLCSTRTMYRILEQEGETRERRDQLVHPPYQKPELLATAPNQLWSWDITKLLGPAILDSPLVTYREPHEHMGEGVEVAFYRHLATALGPAQVIILENEEPPDDLKDSIAFTGFTKNRSSGRYGLFPPLPLNEHEPQA